MRTLRTLTLAVALSLTLPVFAAPAFAGSGKAIIPPLHTYYSSSSNAGRNEILISNITDNTIKVTITLYDHDGNIIYEPATGGTGDVRIFFEVSDSYSESTSSSGTYTATFDIASKKSCRLTYQPLTAHIGSTKIMFGTIEWENDSQDDDDEVALVATSAYTQVLIETSRKSESTLSTLINNGLPF